MNVEIEAQRIINFIKRLHQKTNTTGIVIGLSGGIDSATTAALCVRAIGNENLFALIMPIGSNHADLEDGALVATDLDIQYKIIDLTASYNLLVQILSSDEEVSLIAMANLKPRLRMCTLYFYANQRNALVVGTGNKSEDDIGYFTKYGDGGVDFLPLQHLYKHEVRDIARHLGIPTKILNRKPTAGLWVGQTDEDELSNQLGFSITYTVLDEMLKRIHLKNFDSNDERYQRILELMQKNKHKLALPPALKRS